MQLYVQLNVLLTQAVQVMSHYILTRYYTYYNLVQLTCITTYYNLWLQLYVELNVLWLQLYVELNVLSHNHL